MTTTDRHRRISSGRRFVAGVLGAGLLTLSACSAIPTGGADIDTASSGGGELAAASDSSTESSAVFDASTVHEIAVEFDEADYEAMIDAYVVDGEKEWIEATVTIDGVTYTSAGIRLKGNSSLRNLAGGGAGGPGGDVSADAPEGLPWLIKLDKYVDGQNHDGINDLVVRSNNSATSLNEAVALDLLEAAGLAAQDAVATRFSVNGSDDVLRLVIEHPDDVWMADTLGEDGALYKAESTGDYSYRGDDPDSYDEVFDQEAGDGNADLSPLIEFLDFINNSDDATFEAEIGDWLDVDAFATYLAMQDIVQNFDDIDGPGNNSYLYYDPDSGQFTVVPWDHNLAFGDAGFGIGGTPGGGAGGGPGGVGADGLDGAAPVERGARPGRPIDATGAAGDEPAAGFQAGGRPDRAGGGGGPGGSNILVERMLAIENFAALTEDRLAELTSSLVDSGLAAEIVATWADVLEREASDLVSADVIAGEAGRLTQSL